MGRAAALAGGSVSVGLVLGVRAGVGFGSASSCLRRRAVLTAIRKMLGVKLRVTGTENLVERPTLFVANHFTRIETFLIPYVIFRHAGRQVHSLGTPTVFKGLFGKYFEALGGMSTRDPRRNRTIVRELMTGRHAWVIYPEGGLIKNKKTMHRGRLHLTHPERAGPPHTGAALLALKSEMCKRRYLMACETDDLTDTVSYSDLIDAARALCRDREFKLIERLGAELYARLRPELPGGAQLWLRVTKLHPPVEGLRDGVSFSLGDWEPVPR